MAAALQDDLVEALDQNLRRELAALGIALVLEEFEDGLEGRLEDFFYDMDDSLTRSRLVSDLRYLEQEYFGEENYLNIDDRPVLFLYIANALKGDLPAAFEAVYDELDTEPYLLADISFQSPASSFPITQVADAVTDYSPYSSQPDIEEIFHDRYQSGNRILHLGAVAVDVGYIPVVIPGYNDTEIPDHQREDNPVLSASPERYARVIEQVAPHLADAEAVLITSFNEWYENTEIEPNGTYGAKYLQLTRDRLATGEYPRFEVSGSRLHLDFNKTVVPSEVNPDSTDDRRLSFMTDEIRFAANGEEIVAYDIGVPNEEPLFLEGVFGPGSHDGRTWRWFGGYTEESTVLIEADISSADQLVLRGHPMVDNEITAEVYLGGELVGFVDFGKRDGFDDYTFSI